MLRRYWDRVLDFRHDPLFPSSWAYSLWFALWNAEEYR